MKSSSAYLALSLFAFAGLRYAYGVNVSCYVCMGRDMESCARGKTVCNGHCYKVVDQSHDLISKGCTEAISIEDPRRRETEDWSPEPHIQLYWTNADDRSKPREYVRGRTYFCNDASMCNAATINSVLAFHSFITIAFLAIVVPILWR